MVVVDLKGFGLQNFNKILLCLLFLFASCDNRQKKVESNFSYQENYNTENNYSDTVRSKLLFKIPLKHFFSKNAYNKFISSDTPTRGLMAPISLIINGSNFYIPNTIESIIHIYNSDGNLSSRITIPDSIDFKIEYIDLLPNGCILSNHYLDYEIKEYDPYTNTITFSHRSNPETFKINDSGNFVFLWVDTFYNKSGAIDNAFVNAGTIIYDFLVAGNRIALVYYDSDLYILKVMSLSDSYSHEYKLNDKYVHEYLGVNLIGKVSENEILCIFSDLDHIPLLCKVNVLSGKITNKRYLYNDDSHQGYPLIGENISIWPSGVIYKYSSLDHKLYAMKTYDDYIYLYCYEDI